MDGLAHRPSNPPAITESGSSLFQINQKIIMWNYLKMKLSRLFKTEVLFLPQVVVMVFPHLADCKDCGNQNRSISQMVTKSPPLVLLPNVFFAIAKIVKMMTIRTDHSHIYKKSPPHTPPQCPQHTPAWHFRPARRSRQLHSLW